MLIENIVSLLMELILEIICIIFFYSPGQVQLAKLFRVNMKSFKKSVLSKESWEKNVIHCIFPVMIFPGDKHWKKKKALFSHRRTCLALGSQ